MPTITTKRINRGHEGEEETDSDEEAVDKIDDEEEVIDWLEQDQDEVEEKAETVGPRHEHNETCGFGRRHDTEAGGAVLEAEAVSQGNAGHRQGHRESEDQYEGPWKVKKKRNNKKLESFTLVKPRGANTITGAEGWIEVEFMMDSGATDTVMPADELEEVPVEESTGSRLGWSYRVANGDEVANEGQKTFTGYTWNGDQWSSTPKTVTAQVANITQPLMAVKKMAKAGYRVIFDEEGSGALNKITGEWTPLNEKEDAYFLKMWVRTQDIARKGPGEGFHRQGPW